MNIPIFQKTLDPFNHFMLIQARFAYLRSAAVGHFVSARGSLLSPGVILVNYKVDSISKYVHLSDNYKIDITRKITKFVNLKFYDA